MRKSPEEIHTILRNPSIDMPDNNFIQQRNLPLIAKLEKAFVELNLKTTLVIAVQHLCSTTEVLFNTLFKFQLAPKNLHVLGKCYSTNPQVLANLRKKGVNASVSSLDFNSAVPFDIDFDRYIDEMLKQIMSEKDLYTYEKIIVLDDGGHLLEKAHHFLSKDLPIMGIEQTSSGFNRMRDKNISFPIINLARSWLKLEYESPIIVELVLRKIKEKISKFNASVKNILLIGYGVLGQKVFQALKEEYCISIFDSNPEKSMITSNDFKGKLPEFDLIIGCSGSVSLTHDDFRYLKRPVILASISSSDREFEAFKLRKLQPHKNCHADITAEGITLLNSGFPLNFDEDYDSVDTDDFQLTRALILASIYQASLASSKLNGFVPLRDDLQKTILIELQSV